MNDTPTPSDSVELQADVSAKGLTMADLIRLLPRHKRTVLGIPIAAAILSGGASLLLPNVYTATTKVLPPQQTQSTSAVLAQLGSLAGLAGAAGGSALKNPNDLYVGMLRSRTVGDSLIKRFDLNKVYEQEYQSLTRKRLEKTTVITAGKDGIITINVDDKDPKRAVEIANGYVDELFKLTKVLAVTEASQRRLFFERQLAQAKENLDHSEAATRRALETGGLVLVEGQGRVMAETNARLRAEITLKEVQIGAMRMFASDQNPDLLRAQQQIDVLKRELARIEGAESPKSTRPIGETNIKGIQNLRLLRDMKYNEVTYELLAKQYEMAKIDEAKDSAIIQVMDEAILPDRPSSPKRSLIAICALAISFFLVVLYVGIRETMRERHK
jgi:tyrosine-protein kinase Etk/Wzc